MSYAGIFITRKIFNSDMVTLEQRLKTFDNKEWRCAQSKNELSTCGFYYTGEGENVQCFHCGVGLFDWKTEDNPWMEHALNSPLCPFLLLNKHKSNGFIEDSEFSKFLVFFFA